MGPGGSGVTVCCGFINWIRNGDKEYPVRSVLLQTNLPDFCSDVAEIVPQFALFGIDPEQNPNVRPPSRPSWLGRWDGPQ